MAHYGPLWPTMAHYGPLWPTMAHYGPLWPTKHLSSSCRIPAGPVTCHDLPMTYPCHPMSSPFSDIQHQPWAGPLSQTLERRFWWSTAGRKVSQCCANNTGCERQMFRCVSLEQLRVPVWYYHVLPLWALCAILLQHAPLIHIDTYWYKLYPVGRGTARSRLGSAEEWSDGVCTGAWSWGKWMYRMSNERFALSLDRFRVYKWKYRHSDWMKIYNAHQCT